MKMLKFVLLGFVVFIFLLFLVNRYIYSLIGLLFHRIGFWEYKSICVPVENAGNQKLKLFYDIPKITEAVIKTAHYIINGRTLSKYNLLITRDFNGVKYNIEFTNTFSNKDEPSEFNLSTQDFGIYPNNTNIEGESCTTPNYVIKRNAYLMVDGLPLNDLQKAELKQYIRVKSNVSLGFFNIGS